MAEQLEIIIGANVDDAKAGINSLSQTLDSFAKQGKLSIGILEKTLEDLRAQIKITTNPADAQKLGEAFRQVQLRINSLKLEGGLSAQLGGISRATRTAHADLEQMSQSIRGLATGSERGVDALGNLVFTFERLSGITGGAGAAFSALGETLLGPAGLILAVTTLLPIITSFVEDLFNSEDAAQANQKAFDDLNATLNDSKKAFASLQTEVKFLDQVGPINLDIQFGKGFQTDILDLNARVLELNNEILAQQKVFADARAARAAADKALSDAEINSGKKVIEEKKKQAAEAVKVEEDANKELTDLENERSVLFRKTQQTRTNEQRAADKQRADDAKAAASELNRTLIALAKEAEKAFDVPLRLKFDSTDLDVEKLRKARDILAGIQDFTIKARVDIVLPEIKELPKEQVDKFFMEVPGSLQDAINKGLIESEGRELKIDTSPFSKEIQAEIDKFNQAGLKIPVTFDLKDADLLQKLREAFKIETIKASFKFDSSNIQKSLDDVSKLILNDKELQDALKLALTVHADPVEFAKAINDIKNSLSKVDIKKLDIALEAGDIKVVGLLQKSAQLTDQVNKAIDDALQNVSTEGLAALGQTLGDALSGGDIGKGFENFAKALGSAVEALGKQIIALGVATALAKSALKSLNPAITIAAGIALVAIGEALKNLLGGGLQGFEKGGRPPAGEWVIVGEKGPELFKTDSPGRIYSNNESRSLLSSSVKEHETIREYIIANRVSQTIKEYFNTSFTERIRLSLVPIESKISDSVRSITSNNDKLTAYSYKLHEQSSQTIQRIVALTEKTFTYRNSESALISNMKERFTSSVSDSLTDNNQVTSVEKITASITLLKESLKSDATEKQFSSTVKEYSDAIREAVASVATSFTDKQFSSETISTLKESSVADRVKYFTSATDKDSLIKTDSVETYHDTLVKAVSSFKESISSLKESDSSSVVNLAKYFTSSTDHDVTTMLKESLINNNSSLLKEVNSLSNQSKELVINNTNGNSLIKEYLSFVNKEHDQNHTFVKENTESLLKEFISLTNQVISNSDKVLPYEKPPSATIVKGDESKYYETIFNIYDKLTSSFKELHSSSDRLHDSIESISVDKSNYFDRLEKVVVNNLTSSRTASNKFTDHFASSFKEPHSTSIKAITTNITSSIDKISERSDRSVTIERIINNNFFSSESFKESFKSMSLMDLQKTFHIPAFATGGAVFGPTLAILGEGFGISRSNPEFVGTASQLKGIQSGVFDVNVNVDGELSFSMGKLAIALNREQRSSFRTSGKKGF